MLDHVTETSIPPNTAPFGLVVRFTIRAGSEDEFDALTQATVTEINEHEPGTLLYGVHTVSGAPRTRIFYELYRDRAAFDDHENQPHVRRFLDHRDKLLEDFQVDWLTPTTYAGLDKA